VSDSSLRKDFFP